MADFRDLLEAGDVDGCRRYWAAAAPHLPQPETYDQAEMVMHRARTEAESVSKKARNYSHRWLTERNLPSGLFNPDNPRIVESVGISVNFQSEWMKPAKPLVEAAMSDAVQDAYASGRTDPAFVSARMAEAKAKTMRGLFGRRP